MIKSESLMASRRFWRIWKSAFRPNRPRAMPDKLLGIRMVSRACRTALTGFGAKVPKTEKQTPQRSFENEKENPLKSSKNEKIPP